VVWPEKWPLKQRWWWWWWCWWWWKIAQDYRVVSSHYYAYHTVSYVINCCRHCTVDSCFVVSQQCSIFLSFLWLVALVEKTVLFLWYLVHIFRSVNWWRLMKLHIATGHSKITSRSDGAWCNFWTALAVCERLWGGGGPVGLSVTQGEGRSQCCYVTHRVRNWPIFET